MIDKLKYIEETKETMDKNTQKLSELVEDISGIHTGKTILGYLNSLAQTLEVDVNCKYSSC